MNYKISGVYPAEARFEISEDVNGNNFLVIYGNHINGAFCCIPNWKVGCEMGSPSDTFYNTEALMHCGVSKCHAKAIAAAICDVADQLG